MQTLRFGCGVLLFLFLFSGTVPAVPDGIILSYPGGGQGRVVFDGSKHAPISCDECHIAGLYFGHCGFLTRQHVNNRRRVMGAEQWVKEECLTHLPAQLRGGNILRRIACRIDRPQVQYDAHFKVWVYPAKGLNCQPVRN